MSDEELLTQEFAKNPNPEIRISCSVCQREYPLSESLKEETMPPPFETVMEGFLLCPTCGDRRHSYYMSESLRWRQSELKKAMEKFSRTRTGADWHVYIARQKRFQAFFDAAQARYAILFKREEIA